MIKDFKNRLLGSDSRTKKASKNTLASICVKGVDTFVYLALVPLTLGYLNQYEYGIWLTLNSILMWINSFDIGLGNGLRNKLAESEAIGNKDLSKSYVSTTFFMLIFLMGMILFVGGIAIYCVDWYNVLGTSSDMVPNLKDIVFSSFLLFCLTFVMKFVGNVYLAKQLPAINNLMVSSGHLLSLILIYILTKITTESLLFVAIAYSISPLIIYLIAYPITFRKVYAYLSPSWRCYDKKYLNSLLNVGVQFFFLQVAGIVLFSLSNIIISHEFGPENVTPYNISYRYFSMTTMLMGIISAPMWSATTDAYAKNEFQWISSNLKRIKIIIFVMCLVVLFMLFASKIMYRLWVGPHVEVPLLMSALMSIYVFVIIWSTSYSNFLNGMGKLKLQTINTVAIAVAFYPVCLLFANFMGIYGIIVGMIFLNGVAAIINTVQLNLILNHKAKGLWNK